MDKIKKFLGQQLQLMHIWYGVVNLLALKRFIIMSVAAIIENEHGEILLLKRSDKTGFPCRASPGSSDSAARSGDSSYYHIDFRKHDTLYGCEEEFSGPGPCRYPGIFLSCLAFLSQVISEGKDSYIYRSLKGPAGFRV